MTDGMKPAERFDAIVIGTGQGGKPLGLALADAGRRTALIERGPVGGTCINYGCTPTKTMVASARVAWMARRAGEYGVHVSEPRVDQGQVRARKQGIVDSFRDGGRNRILDTENAELVEGEARFAGPKTLAVKLAAGGERRLEADLVFINTGARPARPPIPGLDAIETLDSTSIMELETTPEHLVVLGGGYIGLEFGQMFRRFGSRVTIIQRGPRLLPREDDDVSEEVAKILHEEGVDILLGAETERVERTEETIASPAPGVGVSAQPPGVRLTVHVEGEAHVVEGSHLLTAAGRSPNTEELDLAAAGIALDGRGFIRVNERLETNVPGVYALGDVKGGPAFTHISYDDYRILERNLLGDGGATTRDRLVPYTVFIDPQLGRIGPTERETRERGLDVRVAKIPMGWVARAIETGETRGFMKALVDAKSERILGCAVLGMEGGEIMTMIQLAMMGDVPYTALRDGVFAHPLLAESLNTLFGSLDG